MVLPSAKIGAGGRGARLVMLTWGVSSDAYGRFGGVVLVIAGTAFVVLAAVAMLTNHDALAGAFGVLALLGFSLAALAPRMKGEVRAGLNGFRFELVREVVDVGERVGSPDEVILEAVRKALREQELPTEGPQVPAPQPRAAQPAGDEAEVAVPDTQPGYGGYGGAYGGAEAYPRSADYLLAEARQSLKRG